ncbi:MAG: acetate kinase, partial [Chloroflexi bacterium]|nr:acetate kinase [Chloroflexota bacterium]
RVNSGAPHRETVPIRNHDEAVRRVFAWVDAQDGKALRKPDAVGHRVVHGGDRFATPVLIDDEVIAAIEDLNELAPLHNPACVSGIRAARAVLGPGVSMVAVFDTAFHQTLPDYASVYAIPYDLTVRHKIRRYGFHGIADHYSTLRYAQLTATPSDRVNIITLHLGNGCSASAIRDGRSVDTSMGFTPLEGLVMGTRCGDLDPALVGYLARKEGVPVTEVERWLNERSGLLGISGRSNDMRELVVHAQEDARTRLAIDLFCYRARKYIGAYLAVLGGADAIVFGGGIGENAPAVRGRICDGMEWYGLILDEDRNKAAVGQEAHISTDGSRLHVYVIPVDEAAIIVRDTLSCLSRSGDE